MIEFKGDCGHTIRARDEDAGKVVRCSYCGREGMVPEGSHDELESLFTEVEQTGEFDAHVTKAGRKQHRSVAKAARRAASGKPAAGLDPFSVALKMTYAAVAIIVVAVAFNQGPKWYKQLVGNRGDQQATPTPSPAGNTGDGGRPRPGQRMGLVEHKLPKGQDGIFVACTPAGHEVYKVSQKDAGKWDDSTAITSVSDARVRPQINGTSRTNPGSYVIGVALRINNSELMKLPGYREIRRQIENQTADDNQLVSQYFVPDGSISTHVERAGGVIYVVRLYEIEVRRAKWEPVRALFLPREDLEKLMHYLPRKVAYRFNESDIRSELEFYAVPENDQIYILDALERLGRIVYPLEHGGYRVFQIDIENGSLNSRTLN